MPEAATATRTPAPSPAAPAAASRAARRPATPGPAARPGGPSAAATRSGAGGPGPALRLVQATAPIAGPAASGQRPALTLVGSPNGGGAPLPPQVAIPISKSLGVDTSKIRVHTDPAAGGAARGHGALAFAYGNDIFLAPGQSPTDLPLIAHEVAHVVQQRGAPRVQLWTPGGADRFEREAHHAAAAVTTGRPFVVEQHAPTSVQRFGLDDVLNWIGDQASFIPGFRLFTIVLGFNPISRKPVDRSAANIMRGLIEVLPLGALVTQALDKYGIIDKAGAWVEQELHTLGDIGAAFAQAWGAFKATITAADYFPPWGGVFDRAKSMLGAPVKRLYDFALGLISGIVDIVKDAILRPLGEIAKQSRGWDLLCAVLGKDPITGDKVEPNAEKLIGGFMKLIGQEEVWENIKKANAIARAWAWFKGALAGLMGFVQQIPGMFLDALKALQLADLINLPSTFVRLAKVFGSFALKFFSWAGEQVLQLLQIICEVVAPGAIPYLRKAAGAFSEIVHNPIKFMGNLIGAAKLGFQNFASNFLEHLKAGLLDWLTGSLPGIYVPRALTLPEIFRFVLSVLGISWANIRAKFVKVIGEPAMKALEIGFDLVVKLVRDGPGAAWEEIKSQLANLKEMAIGAITDFVVDAVVKKAIPQLVALFIPGAGFVTAIIKIYDTIMVFVQKVSKIIQVVTAFIDSIVEIAGGALGNAAKKVESILSNLLGLAISFLAGFVGLGNVASKVKGVIEKIQAAVDKGIDWLINWVVTIAKKIGKLFSGRGDKPGTPEQQLESAFAAAEQKLAEPGATVEGVQEALPTVKAQFGLKSLTLIVEDKDAGIGRLEGLINPPKVKRERLPAGSLGYINVERPKRFAADTKRALIELFVAEFGSNKITAEGSFRAKRKYGRRHIISSNDMATYYQSVFVPKMKVQEAIKILAKHKLAPKPENETATAVRAAIRGLFLLAYNDSDNLVADLQSDNSALGPGIDKEMFNYYYIGKLSNYIAEFRAKWQIPGHGTLIVTGW
jgi:hypothetical protein